MRRVRSKREKAASEADREFILEEIRAAAVAALVFAHDSTGELVGKLWAAREDAPHAAAELEAAVEAGTVWQSQLQHLTTVI